MMVPVVGCVAVGAATGMIECMQLYQAQERRAGCVVACVVTHGIVRYLDILVSRAKSQ